MQDWTIRNSVVEIPLFDPKGDRVPFPIPAPEPSLAFDEQDLLEFTPTLRYAFDRAIYLRMFKDLAGDDRDSDLFGHCLEPALFNEVDAMVDSGTVGVALRAVDVNIEHRSTEGDEFGDEVAIVTAAAAFRFQIEEVVSTFPYPVARVKLFRDVVAWEDASELEAELQEAIKTFIALSSKVKSSGRNAEDDFDKEAKAATALIDAHERAVIGGFYADRRERWEIFSLGACSIVQLPYDVAMACITTQSAASRFSLLVEHLESIINRMRAIAALGSALPDSGSDSKELTGPTREEVIAKAIASVEQAIASTGNTTGVSAGDDARISMFGGTTGFTPVDIPTAGDVDVDAPIFLEDGKRIEFWYNEEYRWIKATVRKKRLLEDGAILHTLYFDKFDEEEDVKMVWWQWRELTD